MDFKKLLAELHRENLSTYFVLPLIKLNNKKFVCVENFVDSYLSRDGESIFVEVKDLLNFSSRMVLHLHYAATWKGKSGANFVQYHIPFKWQSDVRIFMKGKYSQMSIGAKDMIKNYSELKYRTRRDVDHIPITDVRLLALEKSSAMKELWEEHYNMEFTPDMEFLSAPTDRCYIQIEDLTRVPVRYET